MKKRTTFKILGIGCLHTFLYLYLIPFVIFPKFGKNGLKLTVAVAIAISIIILVTIFIERSNRSKKDEKD